MSRGQNLRGHYVSLGDDDAWNEVELTPSERRQPLNITPAMLEAARLRRLEQEQALRENPPPLPRTGHTVEAQVLAVSLENEREARVHVTFSGAIGRPDGTYLVQTSDHTFVVPLREFIGPVADEIATGVA